MSRTDSRPASDVCLLVDYDGTLVPIARSPELAVPDDEVIALLQALAARRGLRVAIVSGRAHWNLEEWLGDLPIALWAEHGFWHRSRLGGPWEAASRVPPDWSRRITAIVKQVTASTPGSHVECKTASVAWHYRLVEPVLAARQVHVLRERLTSELLDHPFNVLEGRKVLEVRLRGISKALVARRIAADLSPTTSIVAMGDDRTDEELFYALPRSSVTVAVGNLPSSATYRVADYRSVRRMLRSILHDPQIVATHLLRGQSPSR